ncbi:probable purine permease 11 isoform X1 [Arachis stenosperma]|uniref:probable purine permease 11 isoform X1 n=2 Tax=Arachis stenosperma TaxID=217475 RepID=UPI0025AB7A3A|nr:probable purine permease 11 isoform X1 [Arachis stenosperma]
MEIVQELQLETTEKNSSKDRTSVFHQHQQKKQTMLKRYRKWFCVSVYIIFLLAGQSAAVLLGRLYFDKGGNSKWMSTFVQSAGFPVLLPLLFYFSSSSPQSKSNNNNKDSFKNTKPKVSSLVLLYIGFGLLLTGDNLMYSYGLLYLPVSTYSLLCATQLAFNALFSYFLNSQKFTAFIFNSIVLLTISASLLAINSDSSESSGIPRGKYIIGFLCTVFASAVFSLYLSLMQLSFDKVIKRKTFSSILGMQIYPSFVATSGCVMGLFASGEWKTLHNEMQSYQKGSVSYIMTLVWIAVTWQVFSIGMIGLILEVSSLFSNLISTLSLPIVPVLAVFFFHDKFSGVKAVALLLAIWGFISYIYQHYLDDQKAKADKSDDAVEASKGEVEVC